MPLGRGLFCWSFELKRCLPLTVRLYPPANPQLEPWSSVQLEELGTPRRCGAAKCCKCCQCDSSATSQCDLAVLDLLVPARAYESSWKVKERGSLDRISHVVTAIPNPPPGSIRDRGCHRAEESPGQSPSGVGLDGKSARCVSLLSLGGESRSRQQHYLYNNKHH